MKIGQNEIMAVLQVILNFDFHRVRRCMEALGMTWKLPKAINTERTDWQADQLVDRMPTDIEMHNTASRLLFRVMEEDLISASDNGFEARFEWTDEKATKFDLMLNFVPEDITISTTKTGITPIEKPEQLTNENDKK